MKLTPSHLSDQVKHITENERTSWNAKASAESVLSVNQQLGTFTRPNLLDNWYFGNPVDQRKGYIQIGGTMMYKDAACTDQFGPSSGTTPVVVYATYARPIDKGVELALYIPLNNIVRGYILAWNGYSIDRWSVEAESDVVITLVNGGIRVKNTSNDRKQFKQILPSDLNLVGKMITISTLVGDIIGTVNYMLTQTNNPFQSSATCSILTNGLFSSNGYVIAGQQKIAFVLGPGAEITIIAAKLELGSTQTLAHQEGDRWVLNEVPDYGEQLLRCCMSTADPSDDYANNKRTPGVLGAVNRAGDTMTGALGVNNNLALLSGYTDSASTLAQLQAMKDNLNSALLQLERPLDDKTWPNAALYQRVNGGDYTLIGRMIHTGNIENYAAKIVAGTYTGDGNASMSITLPFTPKAVYVCPSHGGTLWIPEGSGNGTTYTYGGLAVTGQNAVTWRGGHDVVAIQTGGFTAYYAHYSNEFMYAAANMEGQKYNYIAFG